MNLVITTLPIFIAFNRGSSAFTDVSSFDPSNQQADKPYHHFRQLPFFFFEYIFSEETSFPSVGSATAINIYPGLFLFCS